MGFIRIFLYTIYSEFKTIIIIILGVLLTYDLKIYINNSFYEKNLKVIYYVDNLFFF